MRLWTLHPRFLDPQGLVALWREALLARAVLQGKTRGYKSHPQLARFQAHRSPRQAISAYLASVHAEATARGYSFDARKIGPTRRVQAISATTGQLAYEWKHLLSKLAKRSPSLYRARREETPSCHPLFRVRKGAVAAWERVS